MRADARRNRDKLLIAAASCSPRAGTDVSLEAVAKRAGRRASGRSTATSPPATRWSRPPTAARSRSSRDAADDAARDPPAGRRARRVDGPLRRLRGGQARACARALQSVVASGSDIFADARRQILATIATLLAAGVEAGTMRPDVERRGRPARDERRLAVRRPARLGRAGPRRAAPHHGRPALRRVGLNGGLLGCSATRPAERHSTTVRRGLGFSLRPALATGRPSTRTTSAVKSFDPRSSEEPTP